MMYSSVLYIDKYSSNSSNIANSYFGAGSGYGITETVFILIPANPVDPPDCD